MSLSAQHPANLQQPGKPAPATSQPAEKEMTFLDHMKIAGTILLVLLGIVTVTLIVLWLAL